MDKLNSYIGFAIKSKKCLLGQSQCKRSTKKIYLIILSNDSTENLINLGKNIATKHECKFILLNENLNKFTHVDDIKIMAITDESLSNAIVDYMDK